MWSRPIEKSSKLNQILQNLIVRGDIENVDIFISSKYSVGILLLGGVFGKNIIVVGHETEKSLSSEELRSLIWAALLETKKISYKFRLIAGYLYAPILFPLAFIKNKKVGLFIIGYTYFSLPYKILLTKLIARPCINEKTFYNYGSKDISYNHFLSALNKLKSRGAQEEKIFISELVDVFQFYETPFSYFSSRYYLSKNRAEKC
ncbi:MAG: hypothetical protein H6622_03695 [Halobacteriovoraceae bacterium]|nr:hypothetical protein [Halobacteriovoraceae bacterium]